MVALMLKLPEFILFPFDYAHIQQICSSGFQLARALFCHDSNIIFALSRFLPLGQKAK